MSDPVTLFVPCFVDQLRPRAGIAAVELLERLGHDVRVRPEVICCGQPFSNSGSEPEAQALARRWYAGMASEQTVVVLSSSCTVQLLHARRGWASGSEGRSVNAGSSGSAQARSANGCSAEALGTGPRVLEFCEFLDTRHPDTDFGRLERSICLHSSCHGLRDSDSDRHARAVLGRVAGLEVLRPGRPDECCGFGGTFATSFADLSVRMGRDRLSDILGTGAREVVATDLSCLLHLEGVARAGAEPLDFRHIAELLREAVEGAG
ncbi:MAG: (Fe-S)-binding protein [Acidobacteriota bacterium]